MLLSAGSLLGEYGPRAAKTAVTLLRGGMAHLIGSDAHSSDERPPRLAEGLAMAAAELHVEPEALAWMVRGGAEPGDRGAAREAAPARSGQETSAPGGRAAGCARRAATDAKVTARPRSSGTSALHP